ncbi:hypothetical protein EVAR_21909_1 [Eumeta japonica]|uniref:Uncharacterized protein n=1 Tax=Eumeta variegata TaxID=151549 RepID=A0A4C1XJT4_EUMVA|nr:hypothetical protein EVAR_21909_1 [Eumeta japonica]
MRETSKRSNTIVRRVDRRYWADIPVSNIAAADISESTSLSSAYKLWCIQNTRGDVVSCSLITRKITYCNRIEHVGGAAAAGDARARAALSCRVIPGSRGGASHHACAALFLMTFLRVKGPRVFGVT